MFDKITEIKYNLPQSSLKVMFVEYAKRTKKIQISIRSHRTNSLGRTCPFQTVLQIFEPQVLSSTSSSVASLSLQKLSSCRPFLSPYLCYCSGYWKNRKYSVSYSQWTYPANSWTPRVSPSGYFEDFPLEIQLPESSKSPTSSRQTKSQTISTSWATLFRNHRCRHDSPDCFWTSRVSPDGLQSQISWEAFLCSTYFKRRASWTFSGDGAKSWQCLSHHWSMEFLRAYHRETTKYNRLFQNSHSAGCVILQQRHHPLIRREKYWLCHCCPNAQTSEVTNSFCLLSRICKGLGSSRMDFPSHRFQKRASLYFYKTPKVPGTGRSSKKSFHFQELCLPQGFSYQLNPHPRSSLAILLQQRISRTSTAGIQEFLFHGSNSNPQFLGKRNLHGNNSLGIRSGISFPVPMPARRSTALEYFNPSQRTLVVTSRMGQTRKFQYPTPSQTVPTTGFVFQNSKSNFKGQTYNLSQFANIPCHSSDDVYQINSVYSRFSGRCKKQNKRHAPCRKRSRVNGAYRKKKSRI